MGVGKTSLGLYFLFVLWVCFIHLFMNSETSDMGFCSRGNNRTGRQWAGQGENRRITQCFLACLPEGGNIISLFSLCWAGIIFQELTQLVRHGEQLLTLADQLNPDLLRFYLVKDPKD